MKSVFIFMVKDYLGDNFLFLSKVSITEYWVSNSKLYVSHLNFMYLIKIVGISLSVLHPLELVPVLMM